VLPANQRALLDHQLRLFIIIINIIIIIIIIMSIIITILNWCLQYTGCTASVNSDYTVSQKNCADLFLSELRQISTNFNNCWQLDGKMSEILRDVFISHLTLSVLPLYLVKCRSPKFAVNNDYVVSIMGSTETTMCFLSHDQVIRCSQQVGLLVTSSCLVFDIKFSIKTSRNVTFQFLVIKIESSFKGTTLLQQ